jgi:GTP cyclohydrolase I
MDPIEGLTRSLLTEIGEDPDRDGLRRTPLRVAQSLRFLTQGYEKSIDTVLNGAIYEEDYDEMVLVKDIEFFSLCEHHLLPFFGQASLVYVPNRHIAGISKIARALDTASRRLQVQERLTSQLADAVVCRVRPLAVACRLEAEHLCMSMRGVQKPGHRMVTTAVRSGDQMAGYSNRDLLAMLES